MDPFHCIPDIGDEQLASMLQEASALRCEAWLGHRRAVIGRIEASIEKACNHLQPMVIAYRIAATSAASVLALYEEHCALTSQLAEKDVSQRRAEILRRLASRVHKQWQEHILPIQLRMRDAFGREIAEAKAELRGMLTRHRPFVPSDLHHIGHAMSA